MDAHDETTPAERAALDALRAADPAPAARDVDAPAAAARIRTAVAAGIAGDGHRQAVRRRALRVLLPVAALVLAVLVGVAGGRMTAPSGGVAAPAPAARDAVGSAPLGAPEASVGGGPAADAGKASSATSAIGMPGYGGIALLAPAAGLADAPGTAGGYRVVADGDPAALAAALAAAFGLAGAPREASGMWSVGSADGTGPLVTVSAGPGGLQWSYGDPAAQPCATPLAAEGDAWADAAAADAGIAEPEPCPAPEGPAPTADQARARIEAALRAAGLDPVAQAWDVQADGATAWASATALVGGQRTPLSTWLSLGPGGVVQSASGSVARLEPVRGYPIVGERSAVVRTRDALWASLTTPDWESGGVQPAVEPGLADVAPLPTVDGRPAAIAYAAKAVIVSTERVLTTVYGPDGGIVLLPAYRLIAEDGRRWITPAVEADYVVVPD